MHGAECFDAKAITKVAIGDNFSFGECKTKTDDRDIYEWDHILVALSFISINE